MTTAHFTDEMLVAYADGEADADLSSSIETAMADDEGLAERVALLADTRRTVKAAMPLAPVPAVLEARVREMLAAAEPTPDRTPDPVVVPFKRPADRRPAQPAWRLPLAASVALAVGAVGGWLAGQQISAEAPAIGIAALDRPAVIAALSGTASGSELRLDDGSRFRAIASFNDAEGRLCREYELDMATGGALVSVACREGSGWDVRFAMATASTADGYAPASSLEALDSWMATVGAGEPLSVEEERNALGALPR